MLHTDCITEINTAQPDDALKIDIVMSMYNLIEYIDAYSKISGILWQYYRDEPALDANGEIIDFPANSNNIALFNFKQQITGQTGKCGTKDVEIMVLLKYLGNFWRTLEMPLIDYEINLQLKRSKNFILVTTAAANQNLRFRINDTKLYIPVVTLSIQENIKLLKQLESGFKRTINWNKYQPFNFLVDPSFQGVNKIIVLPFKDGDCRESNVEIDGRNFFDQTN